MKIILNAQAKKALSSICAFVELKNTPGSGKRYKTKFIASIKQLAQPNVQYALCNNKNLAELGFNCGHYNNWVIVFKIENNVMKVYRILHGSTLL